jgi:tRNA-2-methylthio-N6-dimethylallyladenosine synthase
MEEVKDLKARGFKEITLLGQNVDSYRWSEDETVRGKKLIDLKDTDDVVNFANLLEMVAIEASGMRIRFSTSHPKDMLDDVLYVMAKYKNICNYIHLPVQSGSDACLERMNRTYTKAWYMNRLEAVKRILPDCGISTDIIVGFCGETEEEFEATMDIVREVKYDLAYMYYYSERPGTLAAKKFKDDVPEEIKKQRLQTLVDLHRKNSYESNLKDVGKIFEVLIEGNSKKNEADLYGRTDHNKVCVFAKAGHKAGDYVMVKVESCTSGTLLGKIVAL